MPVVNMMISPSSSCNNKTVTINAHALIWILMQDHDGLKDRKNVRSSLPLFLFWFDALKTQDGFLPSLLLRSCNPLLLLLVSLEIKCVSFPVVWINMKGIPHPLHFLVLCHFDGTILHPLHS